MKKIFIVAVLIFCFSSVGIFAQDAPKPGKISEMIAASQKVNGLLTGLLGDLPAELSSAETTSLSAMTFPKAVKVKYLDEIRKIGKPRKKAVDKWLKDYAKTPAAKKFYISEIAVEEDGTRYWIIAHETAVIAKLKNAAKKESEITMNLKILGQIKKGQTTDYLLLAESVG